ncbi:MAG: hypothetical protein P1U68_08375 [Verrucomicrobiales bacterium]|nr:hypothetical protein [Verrucomicrobiales bacterium]
MKPPACAVCDREQRDHPELDFDLVRFRDFKPLDRPGHPKGLLWFCADHIEAAREWQHSDSAVVRKELRARES